MQICVGKFAFPVKASTHNEKLKQNRNLRPGSRISLKNEVISGQIAGKPAILQIGLDFAINVEAKTQFLMMYPEK